VQNFGILLIPKSPDFTYINILLWLADHDELFYHQPFPLHFLATAVILLHATWKISQAILAEFHTMLHNAGAVPNNTYDRPTEASMIISLIRPSCKARVPTSSAAHFPPALAIFRL
jgi:hypothetical protein